MYYNEIELLKFVSDYLIDNGNDLHYKENLAPHFATSYFNSNPL